MLTKAIAAIGAVLCGARAQSSVMPLAADTFQVTAGAAPICGQVGAQAVAAKQAVAETIRRGYDKFVVLGGEHQNDVRVVGYTPVVANSTGYRTGSIYGNTYSGHTSGQTTVSGGAPIVGGSHNQALVVKMFKHDDPAGANAIDARSSLGPDWQKTVESGALTCL